MLSSFFNAIDNAITALAHDWEASELETMADKLDASVDGKGGDVTQNMRIKAHHERKEAKISRGEIKPANKEYY